MSLMEDKWLATPCGICGTEFYGEETVCPECRQSFASSSGGETSDSVRSLDLAKYDCRLFPWEQMNSQPRLISFDSAWMTLAIGLVILVLLLALLRTPLPSCWELSS